MILQEYVIKLQISNIIYIFRGKMNENYKIYDELINISKNNKFPEGPNEINPCKEYKLNDINLITLYFKYIQMERL